jgi:hypothetical protein
MPATTDTPDSATPNRRTRRALGRVTALLLAALIAVGGVVATAAPAQAASGSAISALATNNLGNSACGTNSLGGAGYYGSCHEAWCADFAKWVWANSGVAVGGITAAAGSFMTASNGSTIHTDSSYHAQMGDAVVYNYAGGGVADHVGLVTAVKGDGSLGTTNGNINSMVTSISIKASEAHVGASVSEFVTQAPGGGPLVTPVISAFVTPAGLGSSFGGYQTAFQANTGNLYTAGDLVAGDLRQGMAAGTSPSVAVLSTGGYEAAMQTNTGELLIYGNGGSSNLHLGMMAGTSPSIAASPSGGFVVAFQANTGSLYTYSPTAGAKNIGYGMAASTSPSIAALSSGGYEMAFQANTRNLWVVGDSENTDTQQGMKPGTSPSIAASSAGGNVVAFQANTGSLFTYSPTVGAKDYGLGMDNPTSPSVAALPHGGYEIAFQANTGNLWVVGDSQNADTKQGMMHSTSPSIAFAPGGEFRVLFEANNSTLYTYTSTTGAATTGLGMSNTTTPCIASALGGGCAPAAPYPAITTAALGNGKVGVHYGATLAAGNGTPGYTWSVCGGQLPAGLALNSAGSIQGVPARPGTVTATVCVTDTAGEVTARTYTLGVAVGTLKTALPTISGRTKYRHQLTARPGAWTSGTSFSYQWYAAGKPVKNATKSTYVLGSAQIGKQITVKVTGKKSGYTTVSRVSHATARVAH